MDTAELGLRERKRIATRRAIQFAALQIAADKGLDRLTVDDIGRVADISTRTFFNYFPTKEAALIGDAPSLPEGEFVETFLAAGATANILTGMAELLTEGIELAGEDHDLTQLRRSVLKQHPQLFAMRMLTMKTFEEDLRQVVAKRLQRDQPGITPEVLVNRSRLITLVSMAAMRHAWSCWADDNGAGDLSTRLHQSFAELEGLLASKPA